MQKMRFRHALPLAAVVAGLVGSLGVRAQSDGFEVTQVAQFNEPWAMAFLPDGRLIDTEKAGTLRVLDLEDGSTIEVTGIPEVAYGGHYGPRIAFGDGYLWISAGERQQGDPAQDLQQTLGKIVRLNDDGSVPADNPFAAEGGVATEVWSLGHRNPLGLQFDSSGQLWNVEIGPRGGDELNRVVRGGNYGWYDVSNGTEYSGAPIPDHDTRPEFLAPVVYWVPSISRSSLLFYDGDQFPQWRGDAFIGGLSSQAIIRVEFDGGNGKLLKLTPN